MGSEAAHRRALSRRQRTRVQDDAADPTTTRRRATTTRTRAAATADVAATTSPAAVVAPVVTANRLPSNTVALLSSVAVAPAGVTVLTSTLTPVLSSASAVAASSGSSTTGKLSTGGLVAIIVVCVLLGLGAIAFIAWRCFRRRDEMSGGRSGPGIAYAGKAMTQRSSFGNNGNIPPIYAAHANGGSNANLLRRSTGDSDKRNLLAREASQRSDYDFKQANGPFDSPPRQDPHAFNDQGRFTQPKPAVTAGMFNQAPSAHAVFGNVYSAPPASAPAPPVPVTAPAAAATSPFADQAGTDGQTIYIVKRTFEPSLPDELVLFVHDKVVILQGFDDGWCLGANLSSSAPGQEPHRGVFPRDCVEEAEPKPAGAVELTRAPTLPPLNIPASSSDYFGAAATNGTAPAIQVSGPDGRSKHMSAADVMLSAHDETDVESPSILSSFPLPQSGKRQANGQPVKRTSSLIQGRDAELVVALGKALDRQ